MKLGEGGRQTVLTIERHPDGYHRIWSRGYGSHIDLHGMDGIIEHIKWRLEIDKKYGDPIVKESKNLERCIDCGLPYVVEGGSRCADCSYLKASKEEWPHKYFLLLLPRKTFIDTIYIPFKDVVAITESGKTDFYFSVKGGFNFGVGQKSIPGQLEAYLRWVDRD